MRRVDLEARTITASVRDLVRPPGTVPSTAGMLSSVRVELGNDVHRRYREEREERQRRGERLTEFRAEVTLSAAFSVPTSSVPTSSGGTSSGGTSSGSTTRGCVSEADASEVDTPELDGSDFDGSDLNTAGVDAQARTVTGAETFTAQISGRADGLHTEKGGARLIVEEVKSVTNTAAEMRALTLRDLADAALQVRLYALLIARTHPGARVHARLVLISVLGGEERTLDVPFSEARVAARLQRLLLRMVDDARRSDARAARRANAVGQLSFPHAAPRPHQDTLMGAIGASIGAGRPVLAEAPTGIGKTAAALLPALRMALEHDAVVVYATAKRTQRTRVAETFEALAAASGACAHDLRAITLRPRRDMCPTGTLVCDARQCPLLANLQRTRLREPVLDALLQRGAHIDPQAVYDAGDRHTLCPYVLSQMLCARVDLVIGDYNHVYGPMSLPDVFPGEDAARSRVVIVDEAHNLLDRAREYDSPFLPREAVDALGRVWRPFAEDYTPLFAQFGADDFEFADRLGSFLRALLSAIDRVIADATECGSASADGRFAASLPRDTWRAFAARSARLMVEYVAERGPDSGPWSEDPVLEVLGQVIHLSEALQRRSTSLMPYAAAGDPRIGGGARDAGVGVCCLDPAERLRACHDRALATVAMSATLSPLSHYRTALGFDDLHPVEVALPSPFPSDHRCTVVVPTVDTTWRGRGRHYHAIAQVIEEVVSVRPGHYAAYFPSFRFLESVRTRLDMDPASVLVQWPRMPDVERATIMRRLTSDARPVLLLAVAGGVFAEGIDLPGDALIGSIVVGPALPRAGFERDSMRAYYDENGNEGFERAMVYPGMQRVIQAAGRVHRHESDRGVVVLLGRRFAQPGYASCLPTYWHDGDVRALVSRWPVDVLEEFWDRAGDAPAVSCRDAARHAAATTGEGAM